MLVVRVVARVRADRVGPGCRVVLVRLARGDHGAVWGDRVVLVLGCRWVLWGAREALACRVVAGRGRGRVVLGAGVVVLGCVWRRRGRRRGRRGRSGSGTRWRLVLWRGGRRGRGRSGRRPGRARRPLLAGWWCRARWPAAGSGAPTRPDPPRRPRSRSPVPRYPGPPGRARRHRRHRVWVGAG